MPRYSDEEQRNIDAVNSLFSPDGPEDRSVLFAEDAVWWNGLPYVAGNGQTEHKGIEAIRKILTGAGSKAHRPGVDSYDLSTAEYEDLVVLADGDYVMRQHTYRAKTHGGQNYTNVYCFVFKMNAEGKIQYLTEHWNTWHAYNTLFNNFDLEPAHPEG